MGLLDGLFGGGGSMGAQAPGLMNGASPTLSDRLSNPLAQIGIQMMAASGGPKTGFGAPIAAGLMNSAKLQREKQQQNSTMEALQKDYPDLAQAVGSGALSIGDAFTFMTKRQSEAAEQARADANLRFLQGKFAYEQKHDADELGLKRDTLDVTRSRYGAGGEQFGVALVPGIDADGNYVALQTGDKGTVRRATLPDGVTAVSPGDLNRDKARGTAIGKAGAADEASYPQISAAATDIDTKVQALKNAAGLEDILGPIDSRTWNISGRATDAQARLDQLKGEAFMQARQLLKGGGQITDFEGKKAEQAMARLDQAQSKKDFIDALDDFNEAVQQGARRLGERTGNASPASANDLSGNGSTSGGLKWRVK